MFDLRIIHVHISNTHVSMLNLYCGCVKECDFMHDSVHKLTNSVITSVSLLHTMGAHVIESSYSESIACFGTRFSTTNSVDEGIFNPENRCHALVPILYSSLYPLICE